MFEAVITYSSLNNLFYNINKSFKQAHRRGYIGYFSPYSFCLYAVIINLGSSSWNRSILVRISEKSSDEDEMRCVEMLRSLAGLHGFWKAEVEKLPAELWSGKQRETTSGSPSGPSLPLSPKPPRSWKRKLSCCCLSCLKWQILLFTLHAPFFPVKGKKNLTVISFKRSEFPSIHLTITWVSIQLILWLIFQMKSSRDPHQPFPNVLFLSYEEQCCWE